MIKIFSETSQQYLHYWGGGYLIKYRAYTTHYYDYKYQDNHTVKLCSFQFNLKGGGSKLTKSTDKMPLSIIKRHFRNNRIWVKFIPGKLSLKSSKGFFPSFRARRLLKPTNTMSVDVNALYFTHTSQSQHMLKKKMWS